MRVAALLVFNRVPWKGKLITITSSWIQLGNYRPYFLGQIVLFKKLNSGSSLSILRKILQKKRERDPDNLKEGDELLDERTVKHCEEKKKKNEVN